MKGRKGEVMRKTEKLKELHNKNLVAANGTSVKAWHYTLGTKFMMIIESQAILCTSVGIGTHERSAVWFSTLNHWEPTATKGIMANGIRRDATMAEMESELGLFRLGVRIDYPLIDWKEFLKTSNISRQEAKKLKKSGIKKGSHPDYWLVSYQPVELYDIVAIEQLIDGKWVDHFAVQKSP